MDWIETYMRWTEGTPTPDLFRLWSAIGAVAGALERRVWASTSRSKLYPNLFILLVADPGIGKSQAIGPMEDLLWTTQKFKISANNVSRASLVDQLSKATRIVTLSAEDRKQVLEYHSLLVQAPEFGVLVPAHDLEFMSVLNYIYDNPTRFTEEKRTAQLSLDIIRPTLNIIAGAQPGFLASLLPEEAWSMGFTSRMLMIYSASAPYVPLFSGQEERPELRELLLKGLRRMADMLGVMDWAPEAAGVLEAWARAGCPPVPEHSKLQHYIPRRIIHVIKLAIISCASRGEGMMIQLEDVQRAQEWLFRAEETMPDIFRAMTQKSDSQVIQDLHFHLWRLWINGRKPIHESRVYHFLQAHIPSERIPKVLEVAERSGILSKVAGKQEWVPRPKDQWGLE